ncbi:carboxymuconolactone decarboxylase family protein [Amycolatopsis minnesotensis]|uniref:Carboxymuconolactone decarboxylase family protein n=1 Tax=Amycolatopsis minnesotensis TaxID=337894 RepID=A0ABN2S7Y8_9PSEU
MSKRILVGDPQREDFKQLVKLNAVVEKSAKDAGLPKLLIELVKIRASQLNGCAFCLDMHARDAVKAGEDPRRLFVLSAWRETDLFSEQERAALELAEAMTTLSQTQDVPDEVYDRATAVFTEEQYIAVAWATAVINTFNRLAVTARKDLP